MLSYANIKACCTTAAIHGISHFNLKIPYAGFVQFAVAITVLWPDWYMDDSRQVAVQRVITA
ncbi:MAG: hypothetical protein ACEY3J_03975 [Arsenophonus sp.]